LFQIITTPLTWFIHIPLRSFKTFKDGWEVVEDGYHMKRIMKEAETGIERGDKLAIITSVSLLHRKFQKAIKDNQPCRQNNLELESTRYGVVEKDFILGTLNIKSTIPLTTEQKKHLQAYIGLFKKSAASVDPQSISPSFLATLQ
jgi:hypothetical protein